VSVADAAAHFEGRRILITGGLGFIGSNLARHLVEAGADVVLVDSLAPLYGGNLYNISGIEDRVQTRILDLRDRAALPELVRDRDVVFNLAGQTSHLDSMHDPFTDLDINCVSQLALLEACREHSPEAVVVFAGTRQVYGRPEYLPVDEQHPVVPVDVNGINKAAGEWYHLLYAQIYGLPLSVLRLTNTYGPRMRVRDTRQTFLGKWLRALVLGDELVIFGDGTQRRDLNYVDDAVLAFLLAARTENAHGEVFNLGGDRVVSLVELAELLIEINGGGSYRRVPFPAERLAIDIGDYFGDFSKATEELGWSPSVTLEDGLERSLSFYREHGRHYWDVD
jgi:nucleoside-diphosphate-sugar epimerase